MKILNNVLKELFLFFAGGLAYYLIEVVWRGYSHWAMYVLGGLCFVLIGLVNEVFPWEMPLWKQGITASLIITDLEFVTGCIVNISLGWNVWDYSDMPLNIHGQVCLPFMLLWFIVGVAAVILDDYIRYFAFDEEKPHYRIF